VKSIALFASETLRHVSRVIPWGFPCATGQDVGVDHWPEETSSSGRLPVLVVCCKHIHIHCGKLLQWMGFNV